jgi:hypothetical protein
MLELTDLELRVVGHILAPCPSKAAQQVYQKIRAEELRRKQDTFLTRVRKYVTIKRAKMGVA